MDITNEQAKLNISTPIPSQPQILGSHSDHVIPQMVITSADDTTDELKTVSECTLVLIPPTNGHSTDVSDTINTSTEFTDSVNSALEEKPVIDFEDISVVVRDVVSKCTETVSHSVRKRPLVMETPLQESERDDSLVKCPPPPPPVPSNVTPPPLPSITPPPPSSITPPPTSSPVITSPPTTMQRPLVFEGSATKQECLPEKQESSVNKSSKINDDLICEKPPERMQPLTLTQTETVKSEECTTPTKKEGLHGVKKFFDSLLHHETQDTVAVHPEDFPIQEESNIPSNISKSGKSSVKKSKSELPLTPETPSESKESSFAKDAKQSIKAFFGTLKHESGETTDFNDPNVMVDLSSATTEASRERILHSSTPETPKEPKLATSFAKDAKHNIKTFFDNLKHESSDQKLKSGSDKKPISQPDTAPGDSQNLQISGPESPKEAKESTSFAKDTKQNIKAFFDTFKHESGESKSKSSDKKTVSQPDIYQEKDITTVQSSPPESPKTPTSFTKDTKQNIKAFFDTFKHESTTEPKTKSTIKISISQPIIGQDIESDKKRHSQLVESPKESKESSSFVKDTKQNIKTFFDTFKHEPSDQKQKDVYKKSHSQPDFSKENIEAPLDESAKISKEKESSSFAKGAKQNVKSFLDTFKPEPSTSKQVVTQNKSLDSQSPKETNLVSDESTKPNVGIKESTSFAKDAKQNIKTFFDSFKHESEDSKTKESLSKKAAVSESDLHKEADVPHKDAKHPIKKLFSFKHGEDGKETVSSKLPDDMATQLTKEPVKDKPAKATKTVTLDLIPQYSSNGAGNIEKFSGSFSDINGHDKELVTETKERAQSVPSDREKKKFHIFSEAKKTETCSSDNLNSPDSSGEQKGIKKFFDSFKHVKNDAEKGALPCSASKKVTSKDISAMDLAVENEASKAAEKPTKDKKGKSIKRSFSDKVSREEVMQNFKGFFDSIGHKSSKKSDSEHIYDVVEVKAEKNSSIPVIQIVGEEKGIDKSSAKSETQGVKKVLSPFRTKDVSKSSSESSNVAKSKNVIPEGNTTKGIESPKASTSRDVKDVNDISKETDPGSPKVEKSSMFNAIGENILALKEKVMHTKEKRKSDLIDDSTKPYDLSSKAVEMNQEKDKKITNSVVCDQPSKEDLKKKKPIIPEKPAQNVESPKIPILPTAKKEEQASSPGSLYDTCCIKLAVLLRDKALDIVTERTKSPPPKPPKPSAEAIARARAAAVSRRLEAQRKGHIGENIPIGCDGIRFADDDTESSCDYKDVENFDYIMDYELVNRYKLDSSKLDTFSVPSTCSGLTSYYTADTVTDIYSDAVMETVSLSSDISYNMRQLSSACKSEPKLSSTEAKKGKAAKSSTPKKVPPPIPPKPVILQNISKIKGKSDDKTVSQCVNGLSLSPRLKNKFSKDPAATQKRPLMIADIKETQFSSLPHAKPKRVPPKPARNFETVLKNESLKNISCVSPSVVCIDGKSTSKSPASDISSTENKSIDTSLQSTIKAEKRTKSPPRPPPPNISKKPEKPPKPERPPPPAKSLKLSVSDELTEGKTEKFELDDKKELSDIKTAVDSPKVMERCQDSNLIETPVIAEENKIQEISAGSSDSKEHATTEIDSYMKNEFCEKDILNNNMETEMTIADSLNNNIEPGDNASIENPKPPPRYKRIRSRTVEIVPTERCEERLKRSSSLSDIDVQKRVTFLKAEKSHLDSKSLYTTVNKNGKRSHGEKTSQSSPDLVSCRPLPAPPPPPRRFRSLERKGKSKKDSEQKMIESNISADQSVDPLGTASLDRIKAPSRRRKTDKERFLSLHTDKKKDIDESLKRAMSVPLKPNRKAKSSVAEQYDVNANISNVLSSEESINLSNQNIPNIDNTDSFSKMRSNSKNEATSRQRSYSSWYDKSDELSGSWEIVDSVHSHDITDQTKHNPLVPLRRKSEAKRKSRETSKFYVNMDEEPGMSSMDKAVSPLPLVDEGGSPLQPIDIGVSPIPPVDKGSSLSLVDKETSPLPLDCSEKSVQTSLETLSQGIASRDDDQSEDTDELLDLAQTLQKELSTIINRHKTVTESNDDTPSPPLSAATSEKNLTEDFKEFKKVSSVRSSTSEVWPITSSDESDIERAGEDSSNINEVAAKRKQKKIFYIAREIMTSEEAFVDALKLLNVDFKAAVDAAAKQKGICIIPEEVLSQILNHLPQLQHLNENLLMELKDRIENWDKSEKIADIIVKMGPFLKLYSWYIHDFESNVALLEDCKKKYPAFAQVVKEFEMSTRCKRLALNHYMLKPIQRIPQYRLLLQEYLHHLTEDAKDYQDTVAALQIVSEVANHANDSMKHGDNAQKLISIQNSIMGHKEIVKPGRVFVKEGELMKLSRKGMQPRWFVLFNDLLLYLTPVQQGLYRVNHELPLAGMKVAIPIQQDYQNEFSIISVTRSFTLAARSPEERQEWIIALTKAIEENTSKRKTFTNSKLNQKAQDKTSSEDEGAFVLGRKAPVWIPDARVTMCQLCTSEFTVTFRRHHCRACGKVVCSICSSHRISLPYLGNRIARVCDECHLHLGQGSSACTESGETDSDNQQIAIKPHLRTDNRHIKKNKRMLPSVLKEVCANDQGSTISGYLHKKTGKSWKRDWFVVKDKVLYEYKASEDVAALRSIPLLGYQIESFSEALEGIDASLLFQLTHPGQAPIIFYADTVGSTERWVSALKTATVLE